MKRTKLQNRGWGAMTATAATSLLMAMSAFAQYSPPAAQPITIPDFPGLPTAYPSTMKVTNVVGTVEKVTVSLNTVTHSYANDFKAMIVAPNGTAVVLMSDAGGGQPLGGVNLIFDEEKGTAVPRFAAIGSGTYKPTDYAFNGMFAPAPATNGTLAGLLGSNPNGDWKLYAADDSAFNSGSIGSWTVNLYTTPVLTQSTNKIVVLENGSRSTNLKLEDSSTPLEQIKFSFTSDNTNLVPVKNITVTGSGTNRTVTVTPTLYLNSDVSGVANITVVAEDELGFKSSVSYVVEVLEVNQRPVLTVNTNTVYVQAGGAISTNLVAFITDLDFPLASSISINATSSDPNLINPAGVKASLSSPWARPVAIVPSTTSAGVVTLTLTANDGYTNSEPVSVVVNILPIAQPLFVRTNTIALTAGGSVTAQTIPVSGVSGNIGRLEVSLKGIEDLVPAGAKITLVGPGGTEVILLQNASGTIPIDISQLTFADGATGTIPSADFFGNLVVSPSQSLAAFANLNPNINNWTLKIDNGGAGAQVVLGWQLKIFTTPVVGSISEVSFLEDSSGSVAFSVADADGTVTNVTVYYPSPAIAKTTSLNLSGTTATLSVAGLADKFGTNTVQVVAKDNSGFTGTNTFVLKIAAVNDAPVISFIEKQVTYAGQPVGPVTFQAFDVDGDALTLTTASSNPKILPLSNIYLTRDGDDVHMTLFPAGVTAGESVVTITASDSKLSASQTFTFYVQPPGNPLYLSPQVPITITANEPAKPYPSTNYVSGLVGRIAEVQVTVFGYTHQQPANAKFLLVAPNGDALVLMAAKGGTAQVNNLTLVFADEATATLPDTTLVPGVYKPVGGTATFPDPVVLNTSYTTFDQAFHGDDPNGTWKLYVADQGTDKSNGTIEGWMLSIRTGPNITAIPDTEMNENTPKCIDITVGDVQPAVDFTVTAVNAGPDTALIPNSNIGISVKGAGRTLCFTNTPFFYGSTVIRVTATDDLGNSSQDEFTLTVKRVNLPPVVSGIGNQTTPAAVAKTVEFSAWSPQWDAVGATNKVSVNSDNPALVPNSNISVQWLNSTTNASRPFGSADRFRVTVLPAGIQTGSANIFITVTDAVNQKTTISFKLTVTESLVFAYEKPITIPLGLPIAGEASPYPAPITVSGIEGLADKVTVSLPGLTHTFPDDLSILLVAPNNQKRVMLLSHAGGSTDANNVRLTFSDAGENLADDGPIVTGTYKPAQFGASIKLPPPAPQDNWSSTMGAFSGVTPNGDWQLFVLDESFPDEGSIAGGALLFIETKPAFKSISEQNVPENTVWQIPITFYNSTTHPSNFVLTATSAAGTGSSSADNTALNTKFGFEGYGGDRFLWITNAADQPSATTFSNGRNMTNYITVTATAGSVANSITFRQVVVYRNQAPRITGPGNQWLNEATASGTKYNLVYNITDVDSNIGSKSNHVVYATNKDLIPDNKITFPEWGANAGGTATATVTIEPNLHKWGTNSIIFAVKDKEGNWSTNETVVGLKSVPLAPVISFVREPLKSTLATNVTAGASQTFAVTVGSTEVDANNISVWATSSSDLYVPNAYVVTSGSGSNRNVKVTGIGEVAGSSIITVYASDGAMTNSLAFNLAVNADTGKSIHALTDPITVNGTNLPAAYPSIITVPAGTFAGKITKVQVLVDGLTHTAPANLDMLLVGPDGETAVMLMSGAGDALPVTSPIRLTFADSGSPLPTGQLTEGTYAPTSYTKNTLPGTPAKYSTTLSAFNGKDPNGQWRLYIYNNGGTGTILAGWKLNIETGPVITITSQNLNINENGTGSIGFTVSDDYLGTGSDDQKKLVMSVTSSNPTLLPVKNISISPDNNAVRTATLKPELYQSGESKVVLTVTSPKGAASTAELTLKVTPLNIPSEISRLNDIVMNANEQVNTMFLVFDGDTRLEDLDIEAWAENSSLVPTNKLLFFGKSNPQTNGLPSSAVPGTSIVSLSIDPVDTLDGETKVWVQVTDPNSSLTTNYVQKWFWLTVNRFQAPAVISDIAPQYVARGESLNNIAFTVTPPGNSTVSSVSATSSDENLVRDASLIVTKGTGVNYTLGLTAEDSWQGDTSRQATITVRAQTADGVVSTKSFVLTILPPRERAYTNTTPITITDNSAANPYPSTIKVSDLIGAIDKVTVRLNGFTHLYPDDVGVLLVSPGGQKIILMNRAGGAGDVFGANIKFDQQAINPIPDVGTITAGTYQPADYRGGTYDLPAPAPGGIYTNSLDALKNGPASGTWSLYVYDAVLGDAGAITNGWSIAITTKPVITGLTNVYMFEGEVSTQPFSIADDSRAATPTFNFTKTSSKPEIVPNTNIVINPVGTTGLDFTVSVTPISFGSNVVINIAAQNTDGQTVQKSFTVDVGYTKTAPVVAALPDRTMLGGTVLSVPVTYSDAHTPLNQLVVVATSDNADLLPATNLKMVGTNLLVAPVAGQAGTAKVTVAVKNNDNMTTESSFVLTVEPNPGVFAATAKITIRDNNSADVYPSPITVAGLAGTVSKVTVTLAGFTHTFPQDVSILLVPPSGPGIVVMSRAGGSAPVSNLRLVLDDAAATALPATGTFTDGIYRPADYKTADSYRSPAPVGPYAKTLSAANGIDPNGTWSLYVQDDASQDSGAINQGWALNITTTSGKSFVVTPGGVSLSLGQTGTGMTLNVSGVPNVDYTIQGTTDLSNWSDLGTVSADDTGKASYSVQGTAPAQFFRAIAR